jgi:Spy/CpxP family protein refolding chaperone
MRSQWRRTGPLAEATEGDASTSSTAAAAAFVAMAAAAGASPVPAAAMWPPSGGLGMADSSSSSPHALNAEAQQRLDEIFKAHLPEFINILSQVRRSLHDCQSACIP